MSTDCTEQGSVYFSHFEKELLPGAKNVCYINNITFLDKHIPKDNVHRADKNEEKIVC